MSRLRYVVLLAVLVSACGRPSPEDVARLELLRTRYGDVLAFDLKEDLYLRARQRGATAVGEPELRAVYNLFVFEGERRRQTSVVYLNYYDTAGRFQYQLFYDPRAGRILREDRSEYY